MLTLSLVTLAGIKAEKLDVALKALTGIFADMSLAMLSLKKIGRGSSGLISSSLALVAMSVAVRIMAGALTKLAGIDPDRLVPSVAAIAGLCTILTGAFKIVAAGNPAQGAWQMVAMATAIKNLGSVCCDLAELSWGGVAKGLVGVAGLMGSLVIFSKTVKVNKGMMSNAIAMVALGGAIKILANVAGDFAAMNWEEIAKGLAGIGGLLTEMAVFTKVVGNAGKWGSIAVVMVAMAIAMKLLVDPLREFSGMSWESIAKGLTAVGGALFAVALSTRMMKPNDLLEAATVIPIMAASMGEMATTFKEISKLSWDDLTKGMLSMGATIGILAVAIKSFKKCVGAAAAIILVSSALYVMAGAIKLMGGDIMVSVTALATMAGTIFVLSKSLKAMKPVIPTMFKFSGALATLSASIVAFGVGLAAVGIGTTFVLSNLLTAIFAFKTVSGAAIAKGFIIIAGAFAGIALAAKLLKPTIPSIIKLGGAMALFGASCLSVAAAIMLMAASLSILASTGEDNAREAAKTIVAVVTEFLDGIPAMAASIAKGLASVAKSVVAEFAQAAPEILEGVLLAFLNSASVIREYIPQIINTLIDFIGDILDAVTNAIPKIGSKITDLVKALVGTFKTAFSGSNMAGALLTIKDIALAMLELAAAAKLISTISIGGALKGIVGFAAVAAAIVGVLALLGGISKITGAAELIDSGAKIFASLGNAIGVFIGSLINGIIKNVSKNVSQTVSAMASIVAIVLALSPVIEALSKIQADIKNVLKGMASVGLVIAGISGVLAALGGLAQIPGFNDLMNDGSAVLSGIGRALGGFVGSLVDGLAQAMTSDFEQVVKALAAIVAVMLSIGVLTKIIKGIDPVAAGKGILAFDAVVAGLTALLAALGGLAQIPGFSWLIGEGGKALCQIGSILGQFIGSIISGLGVGLTSGLPDIGTNLSQFMVNATPFLTGAKLIDAKMMDGVKALAETILILTAADILSGIASFITGGSSIADFGSEIAEFGPCLKQFSDSVVGIDTAAVTAAATAAKALAEMANTIPNEGGVAAWFAGENSVAAFGAEIADFGVNLKKFADSVVGVDPEAVTAAANAGKSLAEMASTIPNEGGVAAWFAGENSLAAFGEDIAGFGVNLKKFADGVTGIDPEAVTAAASAGKFLAEMADTIPNEGGVAAWFAGENSLSKFGTDIAGFGPCLKQFADSVAGIDPEAVTAAANAGKSLAEMASTIPNEGGVAAWFAGENSVSKFGEEIAGFGVHLKAFALNVAGIDPEAVTAAASAGKSLAEMASVIPKEGGISAWFAGESSISKFGSEIAGFGVHLKGFSDNVADINPENVAAAAEAGKNLADMASTIPNEGGVAAWFAGESSIAKFGAEIAAFGIHLKGFSDNVANINPENVAAAAEAGKNLAEMASVVPNEGGIKAWFTGESSLAKFGEDIASFGINIKDFSDNVKDIKPENVSAAAEAGRALAELTQTVPDSGGIKSWFSGEQSLSKFGGQIADFGVYLQEFSDNVTDLNVPAVEAASQAGKAFAEMINCVPDEGLAFVFANSIAGVGESMKAFTETMDGVNADDAVAQVNKIVALAKKVKSTDMNGLESITNSLTRVSDDGITKFVNAFNNADTRLKKAVKDFVNKAVGYIKDLHGDFGTAGREGVSSLINGINEKAQAVISAFKGIINSAVSAITDKKSDIQNVGKQFSEGFAKGIRENTEPVKEASSDMGQAALDAARKTLDIHSPSKESYSLGEYTGMAFVNALNDYRDKSYKAGAEMASSAKDGLANAISSISKIIDGEVECDPTIRPVLDLSDVENGVGRIGNMFSAKCSIDLAARTSFNADTSIANRQNGSNRDIVDAVSALRGDVSSLKEVVGNLRVVMDSGALVGQITNGVDKALGKKARLAARR